MKKFYMVVSEYFDDGKTKAHSTIIEAENKPTGTFESLSRCDRYTDYFDDAARAERWLQDTLNA